MPNREPVRSLSWALRRALEHDLLDVPAKAADNQPHNSGRRPREDECDVVLFGQFWSGEALGFDAGGRRHFEHDTVVVVGPGQDACVYVSTHLLYHVLHPNRRFYMDLAAQCMAPRTDAALYEGRDDPVTESVDIELASLLARLHAQVRRGEPHRAALVAKYLHRCAEHFEGPVRDAALGTLAAAGEHRH
jgi:hypothetical protein